MHVIGTAGHVDHGKSALIAALSGMHPDRLKEEIAREMSIDLGFAWMDLPNGEAVGIIDVPGHRDFIENMLAGVGGIDAALFVIAADEGIMPQTREHLAILDLLQIQTGVVALNKIDLIDDPEWLDLVELDIHEALQGTSLANAPIVRVSARTGEGLTVLKESLQSILKENPPRPDLKRPRLPIDRVFSLPGFGTIVTGTLLDGQLNLGDEVEIMPIGLRGRVRGLQSHKKKEETAQAGSRTAVNISGINKNELKRGMVLTKPGDYQPTTLIDLHFKLLADVKNPLKHNTLVKLFLGAAEVPAQFRLLGKQELEPGDDAFIQLKLTEGVVASRKDRYILRRPSPSETLGGGIVLDPHPIKLHNRFNKATLENLEQLLKGDPSELIIQTIERLQIGTIDEIIEKTNIPQSTGTALIGNMLSQSSIIKMDDGQNFITTPNIWKKNRENLLQLISQYHQANPLKPGMSKESLRIKSNLHSQAFELYLKQLDSQGFLIVNGNFVSLSGFQITLSDQQAKEAAKFLQLVKNNPYSPPGYNEGVQLLGEEVMQALILTDQLVRVSNEVIFSPKAYKDMIEMIMIELQQNGSIVLAQMRDHFNTSRKYALAMLEHLDEKGITIRQGDLRILKKK